MNVVTLTGVSGRKYYYTPYQMAGRWSMVPGNYVFSCGTILGWAHLYIGQTDDFSIRMPWHDRWAEALQRGATHVLAHTNQGGLLARQAEERDLIASYQPPMNTQHRRLARLLAS